MKHVPHGMKYSALSARPHLKSYVFTFLGFRHKDKVHLGSYCTRVKPEAMEALRMNIKYR